MSILLLENYIKEILKENKELIRTINIFDFDDTLFRSLDQPADWNTKQDGFWWNSEESLNPIYYKTKINNCWIEETVEKVLESSANPDAITILCTARHDHPEIRYVLLEMLRKKGLKFDAFYFKPLGKKITTEQYKADIVKMLLNSYSFANTVHFWEDNSDNLNAEQSIIDKNNKINVERHIKYYPHLVA